MENQKTDEKTDEPIKVPENWRDEWYAKARLKHSNAYDPWTLHEDEKLIQECLSGLSIKQLSESHGRSRGGIRSRIKRIVETSGKDLLLNNPLTRSEIRQIVLYNHSIGTTWSAQEDEQLKKEYANGMTLRRIAARHKREKATISRRLIQLGAVDLTIYKNNS